MVFLASGPVPSEGTQEEILDVYTEDVRRYRELLRSPLSPRMIEGIQGLSYLRCWEMVRHAFCCAAVKAGGVVGAIWIPERGSRRISTSLTEIMRRFINDSITPDVQETDFLRSGNDIDPDCPDKNSTTAACA